MADNPIKHSDIIQQGNPFGDTIKGLEKMIKLLKEAARDYLKFAEKQNVATKEGRKNIQAAASATQQLSIKEKEALKIKQQLEREQAKLNLMSSQEYKDLIKTKEATRAKNAELRNSARSMQTGIKSTNKWSKALGSFAFKFNALGNIAANVFKSLTSGITNYVKDAAKMAAASEGIKRAFRGMNDPALLGKMREAVRGTVSDVKLMTAAIKANNFQIPLENLPKFFEFAAKRANETGEEVDYLVESIVNGIARRSLPILDNLGLSATELREEMKKTGDMAQAVANIIERDMGNANKPLLTTGQLYDQARADAENMKDQFGEIANLFAVKMLPLTRKFISGWKEVLMTQQMIERQVLDASIIWQIEQDKAEVAGLANRLKERGAELDEKQTYEQKAALLLLSQYKTLLTNTEATDVKRVELLSSQVKSLEVMAGILPKPNTILSEEQLDRIKEEKKLVDDFLESLNDFSEEDQEAWMPNLGFQATDKDKTQADKNLEEIRKKRDEEEANRLAKEKEAADERARIADEEEQLKQAKISETFELANNLTSTFTDIFAQQKAKELSAAGDNAEKRAEIEKKYAKREQALALSKAVIDGASAIMKTQAQLGWPAAIPFIIASAALTAAQIGVIASQKFAEGEVDINGPSHSRGGIKAEIEGGESVINKHSTAKHKALLQAINSNDSAAIANAAIQNEAFHDVWNRTRIKDIAITNNGDPYIKKMYEILNNTPVYVPDGPRKEYYPGSNRTRIVNG